MNMKARFNSLLPGLVLAFGLFLALAGEAEAATSVSQYGITWQFDKDYTVG
jgi:hypothetical protein